jgi:hypothetical protein
VSVGGGRRAGGVDDGEVGEVGGAVGDDEGSPVDGEGLQVGGERGGGGAVEVGGGFVEQEEGEGAGAPMRWRSPPETPVPWAPSWVSRPSRKPASQWVRRASAHVGVGGVGAGEEQVLPQGAVIEVGVGAAPGEVGADFVGRDRVGVVVSRVIRPAEGSR